MWQIVEPKVVVMALMLLELYHLAIATVLLLTFSMIDYFCTVFDLCFYWVCYRLSELWHHLKIKIKMKVKKPFFLFA